MTIALSRGTCPELAMLDSIDGFGIEAICAKLPITVQLKCWVVLAYPTYRYMSKQRCFVVPLQLCSPQLHFTPLTFRTLCILLARRAGLRAWAGKRTEAGSLHIALP